MKRPGVQAARVALVAGLLGLAWWWWPPIRPGAAQSASLAPAQGTPTPGAQSQRPVAPLAGLPAPPAAAPATCVGWLAGLPERTNLKSVQTAWQAAQTEAESQLNQQLAQLAGTGTPAQRAAALYLAVQGRSARAGQDFYDKHPECQDSSRCAAEANQAVTQASGDEVNAIARMAQASRDPQLYGLAFQACHRWMGQAPSACASISADQWAQRDPANGMAWLHLATEAGQAGQESAMADAIFRLTQARYFDIGLASLSVLTRDAALDSGAPFVAATATDWAFQAHLVAPLPAYQVVMDYCKPTALRDANRMQVCNDVANVLLRDDSTMIGPTLGLRLGERLAWPAARLASLREELDALRALQADHVNLLYGGNASLSDKDLSTQGLAGCEAADRLHDFLNTQMRVGEVRELRNRLAAHTLSRAALAARYARDNPVRR